MKLSQDIRGKLCELAQALQKHIMNCIRPAPANPSLVIATLLDLPKTKSQLIAENALLRQQLIVLNRQVRKPRFTPLDRILLLCLASRLQGWKQALFILKPDTLLRWHRPSLAPPRLSAFLAFQIQGHNFKTKDQ